jgi:hypothetical protein
LSVDFRIARIADVGKVFKFRLRNLALPSAPEFRFGSILLKKALAIIDES